MLPCNNVCSQAQVACHLSICLACSTSLLLLTCSVCIIETIWSTRLGSTLDRPLLRLPAPDQHQSLWDGSRLPARSMLNDCSSRLPVCDTYTTFPLGLDGSVGLYPGVLSISSSIKYLTLGRTLRRHSPSLRIRLDLAQRYQHIINDSDSL